MRIDDPVCFVCGNGKASKKARDDDGRQLYYCKCDLCGEYRLQDTVGAHIEFDQLVFFSKAPAVAFERKLKKLDRYEIMWNGDTKQACIGDIPFLSDYPTTFPEKLDRILLNIARLTDFNPLHQTGSPHLAQAAFFLEKNRLGYYDASIESVLKLLKSEMFIEYDFSRDEDFVVNLTIKGAKVALELQRKTSDSEHAFLAMWFDPALDTYKQQVMSAIQLAGYKPHVVNEVHHNDYIMDKVLNLIKESRFVIADLTCAPEVVVGEKPSKGVRGGVYLEAGYAKGLGKPVILNCREDLESSNRIHFDVKQINTIFWNEESPGIFKALGKYDFVEYLKERIVATVGQGPVPQ